MTVNPCNYKLTAKALEQTKIVPKRLDGPVRTDILNIMVVCKIISKIRNKVP